MTNPPTISHVTLNHAKADLRDLLETNLVAMHALLEEQQRVLEVTCRAVAGLRNELRAMTNVRAPWVKALADTRALLFVALREVVTANDPSDTMMWSRESA
ncbi:MAG: hypothetical protein ABI867_40300 [Kofleriaceae bacterium]